MHSLDNVLIIKIPAGYDVVNMSPSYDKRDGNRLIWDGKLYRSFGKGEPALVLSHTVVEQDTWPTIVVWPPVIGSVVILVSGTLLVFRRRRRSLIDTRRDDTVLIRGERRGRSGKSPCLQANGIKLSPNSFYILVKPQSLKPR